MSNLATTTPGSLQGTELSITNEADRQAALDAAFDYRGDVTLHLQNGESVEGYLFNRDHGIVLLYLKGSDLPRQIQARELVKISFSGKDPADGKSYENWKSKKDTDRKAEAERVAAELRKEGYL
jgi:hypothetical protein